ncbi:hypothetical protein ACOZ4L_06590 [Haloplanus ruber]|uniref:HNH endonuclease n=1 Tax=Haloplanus ruber TaxID=869892 RepID=A0ABD6CT71_9EURY|nr:hypothetical protein [Haloplanus ruber]
MGNVPMCHHHERTSWWTDSEQELAEDDPETADDDWTPEEFEADRDVEVELLTDGGDE